VSDNIYRLSAELLKLDEPWKFVVDLNRWRKFLQSVKDIQAANFCNGTIAMGFQ
jgi:hypothetical protein